jgi:hypothetical protein
MSKFWRPYAEESDYSFNVLIYLKFVKKVGFKYSQHKKK